METILSLALKTRLALRGRALPTSASQVLGLKECATNAQLGVMIFTISNISCALNSSYIVIYIPKFFGDKVSSYKVCWPGTHYVNKAGLGFTEIQLPVFLEC